MYIDGELYGQRIVAIDPDSSLAAAGLQTGDTIVRVGGIRIDGPAPSAYLWCRLGAGEPLDLEIERSLGTPFRVRVERAAQQGAAADAPPPRGLPGLPAGGRPIRGRFAGRPPGCIIPVHGGAQLSAHPLGGARGPRSEVNGGTCLRRIALATAIVIGLFVVYAIAHLALIELGREVVVLHKWTSEGSTRPTRLWIVDDGATAWFHHGYSDSAWIARLEQDPVVTIERAGLTRGYRATPDPNSHDRVHQLLREKYGIADWWVRFVTGSREHCPALPVRLELIDR